MINGPANFGTNTIRTQADLAAGDLFGMFGGNLLVVQNGYVSETELAGSMTFLNTTMNDLQLDSGTYVWTWGSGVNADSLTLRIVPEPGATTAILVASLSIGVRRRR